MPDEIILDPAAIENLRAIGGDDNGEFLRELVGIFLQDGPHRLADIESALAAGNAEDLARAAHTMKGSASNFGATALSAVSRDIEQLGKQRNLPEANIRLPALRAEFARTTTALQALLQSLG